MSPHPRRRRPRLARLAALAATALTAGLLTAPAAQAATASAADSAAYAGSCPTAGRISQGWGGGHDGVDIADRLGTPLYAVGPGTVTHSGTAGGYGQWVRIQHPDGSVTEYGHMYERFVSVGQTVTAGQRIASMGNEGQSTGPHLHFEVHRDGGFGTGDDPIAYLAEQGVSLPCTPGGGTGPTFPTWGSDVNVRAEATSDSAVKATLPGPTSVQVQCQKRGQSVTFDGITNDAWSYLPAYGGYLSNIFVDVDDAWLPGVPTC